MSFAAAAFLTGLLALGIPWWLHRRQASSERQRPVSSLMLMQPSDLPVQARRVVRHRWLLALRMLLLTVLVLAFAQPVLERALAGEVVAAAVRPRLIVMDVSASMAAQPDAARGRAHELISAMPAGARAAVVGAAHELNVAAPLTADRQTLHDAVDGLSPGAGTLSFDGLAGRLWTLAATFTDEAVDVHLVSDFQRSAMPEQFNALLDGAEGRMVLHGANAESANWMVEALTVNDSVSVAVRGLDTPERQLDVVLYGAAGELSRQTITVPAGGRGNASFELPDQGAPAHDTWLRARIEVDDVLALDDTAYRVLRKAPTVTMPVFSSHGAGMQLEYLRAAVAAAAPRFHPADPAARGSVAVVVDPGELAADRLRLLERHLDEGGGVLLTVGPATRRAGSLPLTGETVTPGNIGSEVRGVLPVDRSHPVLAGVAHWQDLTVARHLARPASATGDVLAVLDDGTPLLVEHRLGAGRMLVLLTALDPAWSTLVTRPVFVTLIADTLAYLAEDALPAAAVAGQALAIPARNVQLFDQNGDRLLSLGDTVGRPSVRLAEPGIYTLRTPSQERLLAVNVDLRESDLQPADAGLLARWESASASLVVAGEGRNAGTASVESLPLAPWLLALLALLATLEPVAANAAGFARARRGGAA